MVYKINHNFYIREHWNFVFVNNNTHGEIYRRNRRTMTALYR